MQFFFREILRLLRRKGSPLVVPRRTNSLAPPLSGSACVFSKYYPLYSMALLIHCFTPVCSPPRELLTGRGTFIAAAGPGLSFAHLIKPFLLLPPNKHSTRAKQKKPPTKKNTAGLALPPNPLVTRFLLCSVRCPIRLRICGYSATDV